MYSYAYVFVDRFHVTMRASTFSNVFMMSRPASDKKITWPQVYRCVIT